MTVAGIGLFREAMRGHDGSYVLIGGSACDLLMAESGLAFRATKDLDVVVLADGPDAGFAAALWEFVRDGGYEPWQRVDGEMAFYRFVNPKNAGYPHMIELFARHPDFPLLNEDGDIAPLPADEDVSSLSAILLDDDYYAFLLGGLASVDGISVLDAAHLIPLKMRAHIDLARRHAEGQHVNSADLRKHRKDVARLLALVPDDARLELAPAIAEDARRFIETLSDPAFRTDQLGAGLGKEQVAGRLRLLCGI